MSKRNILFSPPDISELEINEVVEALKSGWITTGPKTKEFERRIADSSKCKQSCMFKLSNSLCRDGSSYIRNRRGR